MLGAYLHTNATSTEYVLSDSCLIDQKTHAVHVLYDWKRGTKWPQKKMAQWEWTATDIDLGSLKLDCSIIAKNELCGKVFDGYMFVLFLFFWVGFRLNIK